MNDPNQFFKDSLELISDSVPFKLFKEEGDIEYIIADNSFTNSLFKKLSVSFPDKYQKLESCSEKLQVNVGKKINSEQYVRVEVKENERINDKIEGLDKVLSQDISAPFDIVQDHLRALFLKEIEKIKKYEVFIASSYYFVLKNILAFGIKSNVHDFNTVNFFQRILDQLKLISDDSDQNYSVVQIPLVKERVELAASSLFNRLIAIKSIQEEAEQFPPNVNLLSICNLLIHSFMFHVPDGLDDGGVLEFLSSTRREPDYLFQQIKLEDVFQTKELPPQIESDFLKKMVEATGSPVEFIGSFPYMMAHMIASIKDKDIEGALSLCRQWFGSLQLKIDEQFQSEMIELKSNYITDIVLLLFTRSLPLDSDPTTHYQGLYEHRIEYYDEKLRELDPDFETMDVSVPTVGNVHISTAKQQMIQLNSKEYICLKNIMGIDSCFFTNSTLISIEESIDPDNRLAIARRLTERESLNSDPSGHDINFHQDFIYLKGDFTALYGFEAEGSQEVNKEAVNEQGKKIYVPIIERMKSNILAINRDGNITFSIVLKEKSFIVLGDQSLFVEYARPISPKKYFSEAKLCELLQRPIRTIDIYRQIKGSLKKYEFEQECALEFITLWVMGTYFFKMFESYPKVFINESTGVSSEEMLNTIKKFSFNGYAIYDDNREITSIFQSIQRKCPTLCFLIQESFGDRKKVSNEFLMSRITRNGFSFNSNGNFYDVYCPVIGSGNIVNTDKFDASENSVFINISKSNSKPSVKISDSEAFYQMKSWALQNATQVNRAIVRIPEEEHDEFLPVKAMAHVVQVDGERGLKDKINDFIDDQRDDGKRTRYTSEQNMLLTVLTENLNIPKVTEEDYFFASYSLIKHCKTVADVSIRRKVSNNTFDSLFNSASIKYEYVRMKRNDLNQILPKNKSHGYKMHKDEFNKLISFLKAQVE